MLDFGARRAIAKLPPAQQLAALAPRRGEPDARAKLLYGAALWGLERPLSAERQFAAAARLAPHDPDARTAAAVGALHEGEPGAAFCRLGPLTGVFPRAAVVRFHLGLLLLWTSASVQKAVEAAPAAPRPSSRSSSYAKTHEDCFRVCAGTRSK